MKENITNYFISNKKVIRNLTVVMLIISFLSFYEYIITGYTLPDGICEGLTFYKNGDWALACGRWFVRYFNRVISNNIVIPLFVVIGYSLCSVVTVLVLRSLLGLDNNIEVYILGILLITSPSVTAQLAYPYIFLTFSVSFLLAILFAYFVWNKKIYWCIPAIISITLMMGLYQSYISAAASVVLILIICDLLKGRKFIYILIDIIKAIICAGLGTALDVFIYTHEIEARGLMKAGRVDDFSIQLIFENLNKSVRKTYFYVQKYFINDSMYGRKYIYYILLALILIGLIGCVVKLVIEEKKVGICKAILIVALTLISPIAINVIYILIPYNNISLLMQSHYILLFAYVFIFYKYIDIKYGKVLISYALIASILSYTYIVTSNATQFAIKESYQAIYAQTSLILRDVYDTEGYVPNETKIVFVGYPSEDYIHNTLDIYLYSIGLNNNQVFWKGEDGVTQCREKYLLNYYGINAGHLTDDEFYDITETPNFKEMPIWPQKGSVAFIGDKIVVKLTDSDFPVRK